MRTEESVADRSRDFVALMRCEAGDHWFPEAVAQLQSWLREKKFDVNLDVAGDQATRTASLTVRPLSGKGRDLRVRLVEPTRAGTWTTDLVLHDEPGSEDWISLTVRNSRGEFVSVPRLAPYLMQVLPLGDGAIEFSDSPQVFGAADIDRLIDLLTDSTRHGLVFVAGTDNKIPFDAFRRKVKEWTKEVYGLAQVVVLDPAATRALAEHVGAHFTTPAWTIRTYQPGVDFENRLDSRRHRILGTNRLATQSDKATRILLGEIARQQASTRPADPALQRVLRRFERSENQRLVEDLSRPAEPVTPIVELPPPTPPEPSHLVVEPPGILAEGEAQLALVRRVLGIDAITEEALIRAVSPRVDKTAVEALDERVNTLQSRKEELEDERTELHAVLEDAQLELEVVNLDLDNRDGKIAWLQARLKERGDYEAAYLSVPDEYSISRPGSFGELLDRIDAMETISFTGDQSVVLKLGVSDTNDSALRTAWDAVLDMGDYARARAEGNWGHGLDLYLKCPPDGYRATTAGKFGQTETAATMKAHGAERVFPVPPEVHPSKRIEMKAHFKLARIGMVSPRMYIHDGHPNDPRLYIGYIGPHLTNTQTR